MTELEIILQTEIAKRKAEAQKKKSIQQLRNEKMKAFIAETLNRLSFLNNYGMHPYTRNDECHINCIYIRYTQGAELCMSAWFKNNGEIANTFGMDWDCNCCHNDKSKDCTLEEAIKYLAHYIKDK